MKMLRWERDWLSYERTPEEIQGFARWMRVPIWLRFVLTPLVRLAAMKLR